MPEISNLFSSKQNALFFCEYQLMLMICADSLYVSTTKIKTKLVYIEN
jgi:hypothetical protein